MASGVKVIGAMSDADALLWRLGLDPVLRPTVVAVAVLDRAPRADQMWARTEALVKLVPRLRGRVQERPFGVWRPRWVDDGTFDLGLHLRRVRAAAPGTLRSVLDMAQVMATTAFDPELPLWEAMVVEELADGKAAVIWKLHHALVDGVGGMAFLLHVLDDRRRPPSGRAAPASSTAGGASGTAAGEETGAATVPHAASAGPGPARPVAQALATAGSAAKLLAPARHPLSGLMVGRGPTRAFEVIDLPPRALRAAAKATGGTVNDVFVAAVVVGLRDYHRSHGSEIRHLRVLMPVSTRAGRDHSAGNRFVPVRFVLPVAGDAAECVRGVQRFAGQEKHAPGLRVSDVLAAGLDLLPRRVALALWGSMLKGDDFVATNVPGPPYETYLAGARVERFYAFAPPSGAALNVSLLTPGGHDCVGVNVDRSAIDDVPTLAASLEDGFAEVLALGAAVSARTPARRRAHERRSGAEGRGPAGRGVA